MVWKYNDEIIEESDIYDIVEREYTADDYEELLDELYGTFTIGTLEYNAGYILREVDPIAFDCGRDDEVDSIAKEIINDQESTDNYGLGIEYIDDSEDDSEDD